MERYRGDSYGDHTEPQHHYRPSRVGPGPGPHSMRSSSDTAVNHHSSPSNYRASSRGDRRAFDSPPSFPPAAGGGFRPVGGGGSGGDGGGAVGGGGGYNSGYQTPPVSGQKRAYPFSGRGGGSPEHFDGGSFAKLFVGSVPRTVTEEDIRPVFEEHGHVLEVALIKDKRTGQPQGCCFIKYATSEDADRAIRALHNNYILPGGISPIQVRYADGERERLGTVEYKLFVGSLNKQASVKEVEDIFSPYGRVDDVYLMRDEMKQSRGCGFVKYSNKDVALAAINGLSGKFTMRGCDQPLTVRFADPKRPRYGESRGPFGGLGSGPHFQASGISEPVHGQIATNSWRPMAAPNPGPISNAGIHGYGNQFPLRSNDMQVSSSLGGSSDSSFPVLPVSSASMSQQGGQSGNGDSSYLGLSVSSSMSQQQSLNQPFVQNHSVGPQISPLQKPFPSPQHLPSQTQNSPALLRQLHQLQLPQSAGQSPVSQAMTSQQPGVHGQQQQTVPSGLANQQPPAQQSLQHLRQSPSQLAQMLSQQTQTLQASFQSSQQAFSQLQQQLQMMQPSNQNLTTQQGSQAAKQSSWPGPMQPSPAPAMASFQSPPPTSAAPAANQTIAPLKCDWTEHTAPDGYKYYHNSVTGESKWEKPDELTLYEQQQQQQKQPHQTKPSIQQPQMQPYPQGISPQQAPQMQGQYQSPLQIQFRPPQQLQQTSQASSYQVPGATGQRSNQEHSYAQLPHVAGSVNDPSRFQQGVHAGQEWMWKNKPAGT